MMKSVHFIASLSLLSAQRSAESIVRVIIHSPCPHLFFIFPPHPSMLPIVVMVGGYVAHTGKCQDDSAGGIVN